MNGKAERRLKFAYTTTIFQKGISMSQLEKAREGSMSLILSSTRKWNKRYRVLWYGKGLGLFDSVRHGMRLARGCA